jgi:hypothetical protein
MDFETLKNKINDMFEKRPTKDVYEKCLLELIIEKNRIVSNEEYEQKFIDELDKLIQCIQLYLTVASR